MPPKRVAPGMFPAPAKTPTPKHAQSLLGCGAARGNWIPKCRAVSSTPPMWMRVGSRLFVWLAAHLGLGITFWIVSVSTGMVTHATALSNNSHLCTADPGGSVPSNDHTSIAGGFATKRSWALPHWQHVCWPHDGSLGRNFAMPCRFCY